MTTDHDWLDHILSADDDYIADDGFTARVMSVLPPVATALTPAWRKPMVAVLWTLSVIGIALSLPGVTQDLVRDAYRICTAYPVSLPQLAIALGAAALVMWTVTGYAVRSSLAVEG